MSTFNAEHFALKHTQQCAFLQFRCVFMDDSNKSQSPIVGVSSKGNNKTGK